MTPEALNKKRNGINMKIQLPQDVDNIIQKLQDAGYEAYAVGGCVRDSILGRIPDDWDITTSAKPEQVKALFRRTIDTGIQHGTVTVMMDKIGYEVTTYRIDGEYEDARHPKEVTFTADLREDLRRRDFTINAMAYNSTQGLVDCFGGMEDLQNGMIRCVGNALERFSEDALRLMRAVRFSAQLSFQIEEKTFEAIHIMSPNLQKVSAERIQTELMKLILSPNPDYLRKLYDAGVTKVFFPEFDACMETTQNHPHHCYTVGEHILHTMKACRPDRVLRLAMLFHDIGKPDMKTTDEEGVDHFHKHSARSEEMTRQIMKRLKFDTDTLVLTAKLVRYHDRKITADRCGVRRAMADMGEEVFPLLFEVKEADIAGQSDYLRKEKLANVSMLRTAYEEVRKEGDCVNLKALAVDGKDLIQAGVKPGPEMGRLLHELLAIVVEEPQNNDKDYLLKCLQGLLEQDKVQDSPWKCAKDNRS